VERREATPTLGGVEHTAYALPPGFAELGCETWVIEDPIERCRKRVRIARRDK
jgi:hypothetical protein